MCAGRLPPARLDCVAEVAVRQDEAVAQVPAEESENIVCRVLVESALPHGRWRRGVLRGRQVPGGLRGQPVVGGRPQRGPQRGGGQPLRGWILGGPRRHPPGPRRSVVVPPFGGHGLQPLPHPGLACCRAVGGGGTGHSRRTPVPCHVLHHGSACVELVRTQRAFCGIHGPHRKSERYRLGHAALWCQLEGQVCQRDSVGRQCAAGGRHIEGPRRVCGSEAADGAVLRVRAVATPASVWGQFHGRACPSTAGRGRQGGSGTPWSGLPAGAPGRRGAVPPPATPLVTPPWRGP